MFTMPTNRVSDRSFFSDLMPKLDSDIVVVNVHVNRYILFLSTCMQTMKTCSGVMTTLFRIDRLSQLTMSGSNSPESWTGSTWLAAALTSTVGITM